MAGALSDVTVSSGMRARPWLWFNLLSIDAPLVAVAWQLWFAQCFGITLAPLSIAVLALTVWIIYAGDRLLDIRSCSPAVPNTERHRFHRDHPRALSAAVVVSFIALAFTANRLNPALVRNGLVLTAIVGIYFFAVHLLPNRTLQFCPKETAVGIVFAAGAALAPWSRLHEDGPFLLAVALFASLCVLNCAAIETWEWKQLGELPSGRPHVVTLWFSSHLRLIASLIAFAGLGLLLFSSVPNVFAPIIISAIAFLWLDVERERLTISLLRVLADLPLLSPLLLLRIR